MRSISSLLVCAMLTACQFPFGADNLDAGDTDASVKDAGKDVAQDVSISDALVPCVPACMVAGDICNDTACNPCCDGLTCVKYQATSWCTVICTDNSECQSGCCAMANNNTNVKICVATSRCF